MKINLTLTGVGPMLMHNGRLANPLDPHTREMKALTAKRTKTDEDLINILQVEARGGCWETDDGFVGIPNAAIWRSVYDAAKAFKRGEDIKRAFSFDDVTQPLTIDGKHWSVSDWCASMDRIDYRPVKVMNRKVMRARPKFSAGWQSEHTFDLLTGVVDPRDLVPIFERAGSLVGLGDWRPTYGKFAIALQM